MPEFSSGSPLKDLGDAVGPIATFAAVSVVAFLVGSLAEDLYSALLNLRGYEPLTTFQFADPSLLVRDPQRKGRQPGEDSISASELLQAFTDEEQREIDRLELLIDRQSAEAKLRLAVAVPLQVILIALAIRERNALWLIGTVGVAALLWQTQIRRGRLGAAEVASIGIRRGVRDRLLEARRQEQRTVSAR